MRIYRAILGLPFVYDRVRPFVVGGIDLSPLYSRLGADGSAVVLDIGCGTGDALNHLRDYSRYVGFDIDEAAVRTARRCFGARPHTRFERRPCSKADVESISPTHVVLAGLLHHLSDEQAVATLRSLRASTRLVRAVSLDIVYLPGARLNNLLARLDRGRHCRSAERYVALAARAGLELLETAVVESRPGGGRAKYFIMTLR